MKRVYQLPLAEVVQLDKEDVIVTSFSLDILDIGHDENMEVNW